MIMYRFSIFLKVLVLSFDSSGTGVVQRQASDCSPG